MIPTNTCEPIAPLSDKTDQIAEGDDHALLADYVDGSDTAFAALVRRHVDLVYSAALRQVRDPHTAADVTSAVFIVLSKKAGELTAGVVVAAWLHSTTRYAALRAIRSRVRREHYEQEAARMHEIIRNEEPSAAWEEIAPWLDESIGQLSRKDHEAIILRYFQNKSYPEIATSIGSTEEAVRKRVDRALRKLRQFLACRGVVVSAEGFAATLVNAVRPSPPDLVRTIRPFSNPSPGDTAPPLVSETLQTLRWRFWKPILATGLAVLLALVPLTLLLQNGNSGPLASPVNTFRLLNQAGNEGDSDRWSNLIYVTTPEEDQVRSLLASNVVAQTGLRRVLVQRFGQTDYERSAFPRMFDDTSETEIATAVQTIKGNKATLQFQRGSNFKFIQVAGAWKFDFFRTTPVSPAQLRQSLETNIPRLMKLERKVQAGEFTSSAAAANDLQSQQ
jgi:RNA polymerase sigma factor (sigma-70 family)